jgi:hypothetical protein
LKELTELFDKHHKLTSARFLIVEEDNQGCEKTKAALSFDGNQGNEEHPDLLQQIN